MLATLLSLTLLVAPAHAPAAVFAPHEAGLPVFVAHRGCHLKDHGVFYIPENCPAGIRMARRFGYRAVEMDVKFTSDGVMVVMHDATINRTMRRAADYSEIPEPVEVRKTSFDSLRRHFVLASTDPAFRTPIPTLDEMLQTCKEEGVVAMLHSSLEPSYKRAEEVLGPEGFVAFDINEKSLRKARALSSCLVLLALREAGAEETVRRLQAIGGRCGMSTMRTKMLNADYIRTVRAAGFEVQASIFKTPQEQRAWRDGVSIELSDFLWWPAKKMKPCSSWKKQGLDLAAGKSISWHPDSPEFAGITVELVFSGTLDLVLNGRTYHWEHPKGERQVERVGLRMYREAASVEISAGSDARIERLSARLYKL
jgi:glycerophosphoryl diester phosphodiesterase